MAEKQKRKGRPCRIPSFEVEEQIVPTEEHFIIKDVKPGAIHAVHVSKNKITANIAKIG